MTDTRGRPASHRRAYTLVLPSLRTGGAERVIINLANGLVAQGMTTRVLVLDPAGPMRDLIAPGVTVTDLARPRARWAAPALTRALRRDPADVVIVSQTHVSLLVCLLRPLLPRTTRIVVREPLLEPHPGLRLHSARRALFPAADLLIASSEPMRARLDALLRGRTPVVHLPNPVDVTGLRERTATPDAGTTASLDQRTTGRRFAVVGRLVTRKAVDELLEVFADRAGPLDRLDIVGDGPERGALEAHADRLGVADRVRLHGRLDDPSPIVARADVLIQPSREEGMPNAVLEALAVGTPVLATTDLHMLAELAASAAPGAVRLVPRADLGEALAVTRPRSGPMPRPSLLPDAFHRDTVVLRLMGLSEPHLA